jgi:hypothetical protein
LRETGETITDPDYLVTWVIRSPEIAPPLTLLRVAHLAWDRFIELPRLLRLTVAMTVAHTATVAVYFFLGELGSVTQTVGELVLTGIVAYAVLQPLRRGWMIAFVVTATILVGETAIFIAARPVIEASENSGILWFTFLTLEIPLVGALLGLAPKRSHQHFRA